MREAELAEEPCLFHVHGVLLFAFGLEGVELLQVLFEAAVDALVIEGEELKLFEGVGYGGGVGGHGGEDAGFERAGVVETPAVFGDQMGELLFERIFGVEGCDEGLAEMVVGLAVFRGHEGELAGEVVADGVDAGTAFAFGGFGAGGMEGVVAIGVELFFGDHGFGQD